MIIAAALIVAIALIVSSLLFAKAIAVGLAPLANAKSGDILARMGAMEKALSDYHGVLTGLWQMGEEAKLQAALTAEATTNTAKTLAFLMSKTQ